MPVVARVLPVILALALAAAAVPAQIPAGDDESVMRKTAVTRWSDPNRTPETYQDYLAERARRFPFDGPFSASLGYSSPADIYNVGPHLDILLEKSLHAGIKVELERYIADLEIEGWGVKLYLCEGGSPKEVRAFLRSRYVADSIRSCVMLGDLPVAYFEMSDDFNNRYSQFPSDLYYMDLDGGFTDADQDGLFDGHRATAKGDERPDITIGRLRASPLAGTWGTEAALVNNYLRKVHAFRAGKLNAPRRALAFQDDDWYTMNTYQTRAWTTVNLVNGKSATTAANYKTGLAAGFESVVVCSHSSPSIHTFKKPGSSGGSISNSTLWSLDPPCLFYNLFACSNARYTSTRYMGGVYIFVKTKGLIALGTTKTGSMLYFSDYYDRIGRQDTFGEAFRYWLARRHPYTLSDRQWFYGMTLLGDPTLRRDRALLSATYTSAGQGKGFTIDFDLSGRPDHAGATYMILGAQAGTTPGTALPGARLPLNVDIFTWALFFSMNSPSFPNSFARLDAQANGKARYTWSGAIPIGLLGQSLHFSGLLIDSRSLEVVQATPAVSVKIVEE